MDEFKAESMIRVFIIFFPFSLCAATTFFIYNWPPALLAENSPATTTGVNEALIITTIVGFLTMIVQQYFATRKATRERQWDVEDRQHRANEAKADLARKALDLQIQTVLAATELRQHMNDSSAIFEQKTDNHVDALIRRIDQNTEAVTEAAGAANQAARKIADLQEQNKQLLLRLERQEKSKS